jgi:hypothetical protein
MSNFFADPGYSSVILSSILNGNVNTFQKTITIVDASNFPTKGTIQIGSEVIKYNGVDNNTLENCYRASPVIHNTGATVYLVARTPEAPINSSSINSGWYKERGTNSKTLRVANSNLMMPGSIRFNENTETFQGFNGSEWVTFNAIQGPQGDPGMNASQIFSFINLPQGYTGGPNQRGEVYSSSGTTNVFLRSIQSGIVNINAGLTALSLNIENDTNYIKLTSQPQPYVWDFTTNNSISYLKSLVTDTKFKAFGKVGRWIVKAGQTIKAGSAVRLTVSSNQIVIESYTYTNLTDFNYSYNQNGLGFLGIALENKTGGESCEVCTEGITTAINSESNDISISSIEAVKPGQYAFVNRNGKVFTPQNLTTMSPFIAPIAGYWLEDTIITYYASGPVVNANLGLFYVNVNIKLK